MENKTIEQLRDRLKFDFIAVFDEMIKIKEFRAIDKLVIAFIKHCTNIFPETFITDEYIAKSLNENIRTVQRSIKKIKKLGLIHATSYKTKEGEIWRSSRLLTLSPEIKRIEASETTLNPGTVQIIKKMYKRYQRSNKKESERFYDSLPFNSKNKEFLIKSLSGNKE